MEKQKQYAEHCLLVLVATPKLTAKAEQLFNQHQIPMQYHFFASGTASSEVMAMLGLGSPEKAIALSIMPKTYAKKMMQILYQGLYLGASGTGITFTIPLTSCSHWLLYLLQEHLPTSEVELSDEYEENKMEYTYSMILAFVNQGFSDDVMAAARTAGATGGTVFHSRRAGKDEMLQHWGIAVQQEREIVLIITRNETRAAIMKAIAEECGIEKPAHGIVTSIPVSDVMGLERILLK